MQRYRNRINNYCTCSSVSAVTLTAPPLQMDPPMNIWNMKLFSFFCTVKYWGLIFVWLQRWLFIRVFQLLKDTIIKILFKYDQSNKRRMQNLNLKIDWGLKSLYINYTSHHITSTIHHKRSTYWSKWKGELFGHTPAQFEKKKHPENKTPK